MIKDLSYKLFLLSILFSFSASTCEKDNYKFPSVSINIYANIYSQLADLGIGMYGFYYPNEGVNGLIIYRSFNDEYFVFDRTCTYEPDYSCAVEEDPDNSLLLKCPCCGSKYLLDDEGEAYVIEGPARYNLVSYHARIEGTSLHIFN